jgi:hypothetical protein
MKILFVIFYTYPLPYCSSMDLRRAIPTYNNLPYYCRAAE